MNTLERGFYHWFRTVNSANNDIVAEQEVTVWTLDTLLTSLCYFSTLMMSAFPFFHHLAVPCPSSLDSQQFFNSVHECVCMCVLISGTEGRQEHSFLCLLFSHTLSQAPSHHPHLPWCRRCPAGGCSLSFPPSLQPDRRRSPPPAGPQSPSPPGSRDPAGERCLSERHSDSGLTPPWLHRNTEQKHKRLE